MEGRREAANVGALFSKLDLRFDDAASSPLPRAKETAELVLERQKKVKLRIWNELRPEGDRTALLSRLARMGHGTRVLLVGHEPYLSSFVGELTGAKPGTLVLKKGGVARLHVTSFSPEAKAELRWLLSPRILRRIQ